MPVAQTLASVKLGFQLVSSASNVAGIARQDLDKLVAQDESLGKVYTKVKELMSRRVVLCDADAFEMNLRRESDQMEPVHSPIVDAFVNIYSQSHPAPQGVMNGGQRIAPLRGTLTGEETSPTWNGMMLSRDLLIEAVRYKFPQQFPINHYFDFIVEGMTPLESIEAALLHIPAAQ